MACFHPLSAWQTESGEIVFAEKGAIRRPLLLPCGQCVGCRLERSRQWAVRCLHEAQLYDSNSFVTLTYDDNNLPDNGNLCYRDFQLFMKRLRKEVGSVRFYMCGEYGEMTQRPHFHACLFGVHFSDRIVYSERSDRATLYESPLLTRLWGHGFASIGDVTFESAAYVARYVMKKVTGPRADEHYERVNLLTGEVFSLVPEFTRMSLKPGIGSHWIAKYTSDVYPRDYVIVRGNKCKPPRYYDNYFAGLSPIAYEDLQFEREVKARNLVDDTTPERLEVREKVARARLSLKKRNEI